MHVFVYIKDKDARIFLEEYFSSSKKYTATFYTNVRKLKQDIKNSPPEAIIVGASECLDRLKPEKEGPPVLATVSRNISKSMSSILRNNIENYISPPFQRYDLSCQLQIMSRKDKYIELLSQELDDLRTLSKLSDFLSSTLDPKEILHMIVRKISEKIPVSRCSILSVNYNEDSTAEVVSSFEDIKTERLMLDLDKYPEIQKSLRTRKSVLVKDAGHDALMEPVKGIIKKLGIKSIVVVPVIFRNEIIGTLFLRTSRKLYEFSPREVRLFQEIANAAGKALNNALLFKNLTEERRELERLAITDFLTGIYNIRYLYHRMDSEFSRAIRHNEKMSCLMMDIDHFKRINDTYGHRAGDIMLREFAEIIQRHVRKSDVFARYGGDEFIMLLPETDEKGAYAKADIIRKAVKAHRFSALKKGIYLTISVGIATCPAEGIKTQDDLISMADDLLLQAKSDGRDRAAASR